MTRKFSFEDVVRGLPPETVQLVESLAAESSRSSGSLHLVGGSVRDLLLKRTVRDVDLLVEGARLGVAERLARQRAPEGARIVAHDRFGTVRIEWAGGAVDLATTRAEVYRRPGALPRVVAASLIEDLRRRDFTVNALAIPLLAATEKQRVSVVDVDTGLADLAARQLRVFHDRSFHDDPTRGIRAARLVARLGFRMVRSTTVHLRAAVREDAFGAVSGDRLRREFRLLFEDAVEGVSFVESLRRLEAWGVLEGLEPGLSLPREALVPLRRLGRLAADPPWRGPRALTWIAGFSIWLAPLPGPVRRRVLKRFSVRGERAHRIIGFSKLRDTAVRTLGRARGRGAVDRVLGKLDDESLLALCASASPLVRRRIDRWGAEDRGRRSPVGGNDVVAMGVEGEGVGRLLERIRAAYLDGDIVNREEGLALARELARRGRMVGGRGGRLGRGKPGR